MKKWILTFVLSFICAQGGHAMGFFSKPKHCVFSAVSGHLTLNGEPVKNARLVRTGQLGHAKTEVTDEAITDEKGYFEFPDMFQSASEFGGLAAFRVFQEIKVYQEDGNEVSIWRGTRKDGVKGNENRQEPWRVQCELSNTIKKLFIVNDASYFTVCAWDVEEDVIEPFDHGR